MKANKGRAVSDVFTTSDEPTVEARLLEPDEKLNLR